MFVGRGGLLEFGFRWRRIIAGAIDKWAVGKPAPGLFKPALFAV
jgi:hypothetical protein